VIVVAVIAGATLFFHGRSNQLQPLGTSDGRRFSSGPVRQIKRSEMTAAEVKYGIAPVPDDTVTYQPEVIVVGGGADMIRAQSSSNLVVVVGPVDLPEVVKKRT
jgi:hypothetical protein